MAEEIEVAFVVVLEEEEEIVGAFVVVLEEEEEIVGASELELVFEEEVHIKIESILLNLQAYLHPVYRPPKNQNLRVQLF